MLDSFQLGYIATISDGGWLHLECDDRYAAAVEAHEAYLEADKAAYLADTFNVRRYGPGLAGWYPQRLVDWIQANPEETEYLFDDMVIRYTVHEAESGELENQVSYLMEDLDRTVDDNVQLAIALAKFVVPVLDAEDEPLTAKDITTFIEEWLYENLDGEVLCEQCGKRIS